MSKITVKVQLLALMFSLACLTGCSDTIKLANYDKQDSPISHLAPPDSKTESAHLLSAFFGLDNQAPRRANYFVCRGAAGYDGMPVIFSQELNLETLEAGDFRVVKSDGSLGEVMCVTPAPAYDIGELRTMLLLGEFGSPDNPPESVEIEGNILSSDNRINYQGKTVKVTSLEQGPSIVLAQQVPNEDWELGKKATLLPFGGSSGCPEGTQQILRVVWNGGITKPGGDEVDDLERNSYSVSIRDNDGVVSNISPFALGDLGDGDNNHKLCLDREGTPIRVDFPEGLVTDPRDDLNPKTSIELNVIGLDGGQSG